MTLFQSNAPLYWAAGLQVIPLVPKQKRPIETAWQQWGHVKVPPEIRQDWLLRHPDANIGLPAGPASGLCFVDIDTEDSKILAVLHQLLPRSPWERIGKKGGVYAYKYAGAKSFKIIGADKKMILEFFSSSGQVVVPPSIHPDTQKPYTANKPLYELNDELPIIDPQIEYKLREALRLSGIKLDVEGFSRLIDKVSAGSRDTSLIRHAGSLAFEVTRGRISLKDALEALDHWGRELTEKVPGDEIDVMKGKMRIVEYILKAVKVKRVTLPSGWDDDLNEDIKAGILEELDEDDIEVPFELIKSQFLRDVGDGMPHMEAAEKTIKRVARSMSLTELEKDALLSTIQKTLGSHIRLASLRKGLREYTPGGIEGASHAEIAQAMVDDLNVEDLGLEVRFDKGLLYDWHGSHWAPRDKQGILQQLIAEYGHLPAARRSSDHYGILKTVCNIVSKPIKLVDIPGITFTNGFLGPDLVLREHDRDYGAQYEMPYAYMPELAHGGPRFMRFMEEVWDGDVERIQALREAIAVTLFGYSAKLQKCFLFHGVPNSGKSTMLEIITSLVPSVARTSLPPHKWADRFLNAELYGKVMNAAGELPHGKFIPSELFKGIISGDPQQVERKNQDPFTFKPNTAHWFASNTLPRTKDVSAAFLRRWLIFLFDKLVDKENRNINLADEIIAIEREAIVAWAVQVFPQVLQRHRMFSPSTSDALVSEMALGINPARAWAIESVKMLNGSGEHKKVTEESAYQHFSKFCFLGGHRKMDRASFRLTMRELASDWHFTCNIGVDGMQIYQGIEVKK